MQTRRLKSIVLILLTSFIFAVLLSTEVLSFDVWSQIEYMNEAELDTSSIGMIAHFPRYMVVYPAYYFSEMLDVELSLVYGWYLLSATTLISLLWEKSRETLFQFQNKFSFVLLLPFILLFFVNGRFVFGLLGLSILLYISIAYENSDLTFIKIIGMLLGLLFCTVSSGVFVVGLLFWILSFVDVNKHKPKLKRIYGWFALLAVLMPSAVLTSVFLIKNFSFYLDEGYGLVGILSHGLGMFINPDPLLESCVVEGVQGATCLFASLFSVLGPVFSVILVTSVLLLIVFILYKLNFPKQANRGLILSAFGGVFGITTLMSFIFVLPICVNRKLLILRKPAKIKVTDDSESDRVESKNEFAGNYEVVAGIK
jgi:hypothetical protein